MTFFAEKSRIKYMNISPQTALNNLIAIYQNARITAEEHEALKESIRVLANLVNEKVNSEANSQGNKK